MRNVAKAADEESYNKALRHLRESDLWMRNKKLFGQYLKPRIASWLDKHGAGYFKLKICGTLH